MTAPKLESTTKVPSSLTQTIIITKYTLLDYIRSRRFYILLAFTLLISVLLTAVAAYYPSDFRPDNLGFYGNWWGNTATFVVILSAVFFGGDAISGEFQNKTGYFGVPNPIRRSSIYVGKYLSAFIASTVILAIFAGVTVGNGVFYFGSVPTQFVESLLFTWLYLIAALGFTFFFSSLFKNSSYSILVTAIVFLFVFNIVDLLVQRFAQIEPWFMITYGSGIIGNILTVPYPDHITTAETLRGVTRTLYNVTVPEGLAILSIYFFVTAIIGLLLFERKEFN
ncbi:MAG TPA: ABC transporter permease [Candidatus Nanoarchaeia archaeon]|nr:ABC transporter permease [Candidatus Nanoarchaeia archaeon]